MNATLSWILLIYFITVAPFDALRYLFGPYGTTFCEVHQFMRISLWIGGYMTLGVIISLRYIFIFKYEPLRVIRLEIYVSLKLR